MGKKKSGSKGNARPAGPQHNDSLRKDIEAQRPDYELADEDGFDIADDLLAALDARDAAQSAKTQTQPQGATAAENGNGTASQAGVSRSSSKRISQEIKAASGKFLDGFKHHKNGDTEGENGDGHHHGISSFFHSRTAPNTGSTGDPALNTSAAGVGSAAARKKNRAKARLERRDAANEALRKEAELELEANGGKPDEAAREKQGIEDLCKALGRQVHEVEPDGHCLYAAVADQLNLLGVSDPAIEGKSGFTYKDARKAAARIMREFPDDFKPFISDSDEKMAGIINATAGQVDNGKDDEQDRFYLSYCDAVEKTGVWGGQPEILALSRAYQKQINVVQVGYPTLKVGEDEFGPPKSKPEEGVVFISYHRKMYGLGEHYNSLRKKA